MDRTQNNPEGFHHLGVDCRDTGCDLSPSCLACPFPECRYDLPTGAQELRHDLRDAPLYQEYRDGALPELLADKYNIHVRTVYRRVERARRRYG